MKLTFDNTTLEVSPSGKGYVAKLEDRTIEAQILQAKDGKLDLLIDGKHVTAYVSTDNAKRWVTINGQTFVLTKSSDAKRRSAGHDHESELAAPMPGVVRAVNVNEGDQVTKGQTLLLLEAMKMEIRVQAPRDAMVKKLFVKQGQTVEREQVLIEVE